MRTHDCIRTIAFTCPCSADGESTDAELRLALMQRILDVERAGEWQGACGQDAADIQEREES